MKGNGKVRRGGPGGRARPTSKATTSIQSTTPTKIDSSSNYGGSKITQQGQQGHIDGMQLYEMWPDCQQEDIQQKNSTEPLGYSSKKHKK